MTHNQQVLVDHLPEDKLQPNDFRLIESPMPEPGEQQILVATIGITIAAGSRAGLQGSASYAGTPKTGIIMNSNGVGRVVASRIEAIPKGTHVLAPTGWQQFSVQQQADVRVIPAHHNPLDYLGPLGINGLTAYFGTLDVGQLKAGDILLISAAAGSVGHLVGQMGKMKGAHVVGICGNDAKAQQLLKLGFDEVVNYKAPSFRDDLKAATPDGVDLYFDNTGGPILGAALFRMNLGGRIACCGVVSQYDTANPAPGPKGIPGLLVNKRITMQGFIVFDFADRYAEALEEINGWLTSGTLKSLTSEVKGLAAAPEAFVDLLRGGNTGTRIVRLDN